MSAHEDTTILRLSEAGEIRLERIVGRSLDAAGDEAAYEDVFVEWLETELEARASVAEQRASDAASSAVASRVTRKLRAMRVGESIPRYELRDVEAAIVGNIRDVAPAAAAQRYAPWADSFAAAAGTGREIWDEPCERWIELPADLRRRTGLIALGVAGDSMTPYLEHGETILIDTKAARASGRHCGRSSLGRLRGEACDSHHSVAHRAVIVQ